MSASTNKRVVVYRFDREAVRGFSPPSWAAADLEILSPAGSVVRVSSGDVKVVCFVKDLDGHGWGAEQRIFKSRPKSEGLWVRAQFRDNDYLEGILLNDLAQVESHGFLITPPDATSNTQRVYIPKTALRELKVMGVVGSPVHKKRPAKETPPGQISLFETE